MSWRAFALSVIAIFTLLSCALLYVSSGGPQLRYYVAYQGENEFRVEAHEARVEGFCTVFIRDGIRISGICGYHTWSEAR